MAISLEMKLVGKRVGELGYVWVVAMVDYSGLLTEVM
jgi:hypothetical protein